MREDKSKEHQKFCAHAIFKNKLLFISLIFRETKTGKWEIKRNGIRYVRSYDNSILSKLGFNVV